MGIKKSKPEREVEDTRPSDEDISKVSDEGLDDADGLKDSIIEEKERSEKYLANWQRAQADLANYKKRIEQEQSAIAKYANSTLISSLLSVIDDFERALNNMPQKVMGFTWIEGIFLVHKKLQGILEAHGLSEIKALDEDFDPTMHQAVMYGDGDEGKVIEELQKGFKLHDRIIRPSMVQVGQGAAKEEESTPSDMPSDDSSNSEDV